MNKTTYRLINHVYWILRENMATTIVRKASRSKSIIDTDSFYDNFLLTDIITKRINRHKSVDGSQFWWSAPFKCEITHNAYNAQSQTSPRLIVCLKSKPTNNLLWSLNVFSFPFYIDWKLANHPRIHSMLWLSERAWPTQAKGNKNDALWRAVLGR